MWSGWIGMRKVKPVQHRSLVVEAPDERYEPYWSPETMEIAEGQASHSHSHSHPYHNTNTPHTTKHPPHIHSTSTSSTTESTVPTIGPIFHPNHPFVVLDCANIGWAFGGSCFSSLGIKIAFETFQDLPINLYGFIPAPYVRRKPTDGSRGNSLMETEEWEILDQLIRSRKV